MNEYRVANKQRDEGLRETRQEAWTKLGGSVGYNKAHLGP